MTRVMRKWRAFRDPRSKPQTTNCTSARIGSTGSFREDARKPRGICGEVCFEDTNIHSFLVAYFCSLLRQYSYLGDGTFLVRESVTFVGDYCLSFWRKSKPNHCRFTQIYNISLISVFVSVALLTQLFSLFFPVGAGLR